MCEGDLELFTDAPELDSSSEPFDVVPKSKQIQFNKTPTKQHCIITQVNAQKLRLGGGFPFLLIISSF